MALEACKYYPKQMNGPVISANCIAVGNETSDAQAIEDYLYGLSIATAQETERENIGRIIGYLRPDSQQQAPRSAVNFPQLYFQKRITWTWEHIAAF